MTGKTQMSLNVLTFILCLTGICFAYDSDGDGRDTLEDAVLAIEQHTLKETIHTLQVLTGMSPPSGLYFTRSVNNHLVTDVSRQLMWQDYSLVFGTQSQGITYCNQSELDGYEDWRLPDFLELQQFFKAVDRDYTFDLNFWGTFPGCTAAVAIGGYARTPHGAEIYGGEVGDQINFSGGAAVRCVRNIPNS